MAQFHIVVGKCLFVSTNGIQMHFNKKAKGRLQLKILVVFTTKA